MEGDAGNRVEADEVDAAFESAQEADYPGGVAACVVAPFKHGVFERYAPLVRPVMQAEFADDVCDAVCAFGGHHGGAFVGEWVVEAYGEMALGSGDEAAQSGQESDAGYGDAARTPRVAPLGCERGGGAEDAVCVVKGFAHAHEDYVGEAVALIDGVYLVEYLCGCEVTAPSLLSGHAEVAAHTAANLTGDAECGAVGFGDVDCFDEAVCGGEQVFACAVGGLCGADGRNAPYVVAGCEGCASFE